MIPRYAGIVINQSRRVLTAAAKKFIGALDMRSL